MLFPPILTDPVKMATPFLLCLLVSFAALVIANPEITIRANPETGLLEDGLGRVRVFHGVNAVYKEHPWHPNFDGFDPFNSLVEKDMDDLTSWGMNVVRLGVMWPGVEVDRGIFNETYLNTMVDLADKLAQHGIYTLVDMHQDLLGPEYCGEGVPSYVSQNPPHTTCDDTALGWLGQLIGQCRSIETYQMKKDEHGIPLQEECLKYSFFQFYQTPEVSSAFQRLYESEEIILGLEETWAKIAQAFKNSSLHILGYDLINEPWPGDIWRHGTLLIPGIADRVSLEPLYNRLVKVIRQSEELTNRLIFYEPVQFPDVIPLFGGIPFGAGFENAPGSEDDIKQGKTVLSYHTYCCGAGVAFLPEGITLACDEASGDPKPGTEQMCDNFNHKKITQRITDSKRLKSGGFLTEFGACSGSPSCVAELNRVTHETDSTFQSWAYWQFKYFHDITTQSGTSEGFYNEDGTLQKEKILALSRTYATAIAGSPVSSSFGSQTNTYSLIFKFGIKQCNYAIHARQDMTSLTTEVYINEEMRYKDGYFVNINVFQGRDILSEPLFEYNVKKNAVHIYPRVDALSNLCVKIRNQNEAPHIQLIITPKKAHGILKLINKQNQEYLISWEIQFPLKTTRDQHPLTMNLLKNESKMSQLVVTLFSHTGEKIHQITENKGKIIYWTHPQFSLVAQTRMKIELHLLEKSVFSAEIPPWDFGFIPYGTRISISL